MIAQPTRTGVTFFDLRDLYTVSNLWTGPLHPNDLGRIESVLRGFITGKKLSTLRLATHIHDHTDYSKYAQNDNNDYFTPFRDHLLDYEFVDPETEFEVDAIDNKEENHLSRTVTDNFFSHVSEKLKNTPLKLYQADSYAEGLFSGYSHEECLTRAFAQDLREEKILDAENLRKAGYEEEYVFDRFNIDSDFDPSGPPHQLTAFMHLNTHIRYLVSVHRSGYQVCSSGLLSDACQKHVFAEWPRKIFEDASLNYQDVCRRLRGPGLGVELPLMISIVLSRSVSREDIPRTIIDMREEYEEPRKKIWETLDVMWTEKSFAVQQELLGELEDAAASVFPAAFPEKTDKLDIALDIATLSMRGVVNATKAARSRDMPNVRVSAVSFAKCISNDIRYRLQNTRHVLDRHLSESERREFGLS